MSGCVVRPERLVPGSLWRLKQPACESTSRVWAIFRRAGDSDPYMRGWNAGWDQIATTARWRYDIDSCWMLVGVASLAPSSACDCRFILPDGQLTVARFDSKADMENCLEFVE